MRNEGWKPIPHFSGYSASTKGRIRRDVRVNGAKGARHWYTPSVTRTGSLKVTILDEQGNRRRVSVHRLVALAFHGEPPSGRDEVNHKNGRRDDNRPSNLEWVSGEENRKHYWDVLLPRRVRKRTLTSKK